MLLAAFDSLVEQRIEEAIARGDFDDLPGAGRPLDLDDDRLVPEEMRVASRILKNAGCLPPDVQNIAEVHQLLARIERDGIAPEGAQGRRLRALLIELELSGRRATSRAAWIRYEDALAGRLARP